MTPYTKAALRNLQKGARKMQKAMSPAAKIRRDFQLGRPAKALTDEPLHPAVVWSRAEALLTDLRSRMTAAKLDPLAARGFIVYVQMPNFTDPRFLPLSGGESQDSYRKDALTKLGEPDTIALGVLFQQWDDGKVATFPKQLTGLSGPGMMILRKAGELLNHAVGLNFYKN